MAEQRSRLASTESKRFRGLVLNRSCGTPLFTGACLMLMILMGMFWMGPGTGSAAGPEETSTVWLHPPAEWVGWVASNEPGGNHLGDSSLYAGFYNNVAYYSLVCFDVREIAGAPIHSASLRLSGLSRRRMGEGGKWTIQLLESNPGDLLPDGATFRQVQRAPASSAISFSMGGEDLAAGQVNEFNFTAGQLALLQERATQTGRITFRLVGPRGEENALFAWDSGYGLDSRGARPELVVEVGPTAGHPDQARFLRQSVPTQMVAGQLVTVTLTLKNIGSSTWNPQGPFAYVLGNHSRPGERTWGSSSTVLPGEVTPGQVVDIAFPVKAPSRPGSYDFQWQMIHSNLGSFGDTTEKVAVQVVESAPTPTPTSTPLAVPFPDPTMTPVPTAAPPPDWSGIPPEWKGRIAFISDRNGGKDAYYIMDADGKNVQQLTGPGLYQAALYRDTLDPNGQYQAFVSLPRYVSVDSHLGKNYEISLRRLSDGYEWYIIGDTKGADYQPAYCQADPRYIAYTSQQTFNDDIFVVDLLGANSPMRTTQLTANPASQDWVWDKHPSWSPDCGQIVFYSNRTGKDQIWVMDFWSMDYQGQNLRQISNGKYNDRDPVWIK